MKILMNWLTSAILYGNPPFNVNKVDKKRFCINDKRLPFGIPNSDNAIICGYNTLFLFK